MELTEEELKRHSKENGMYRTPYLNEKLYLPHKGIVSLGSALRRWTGLKSLFVEGNALEDLGDLSAQAELRCLFAGKNDLRGLGELKHTPKLATLDISGNRVGGFRELEHVEGLGTLLAGSNGLAGLERVAELEPLKELHTLDLSGNRLDGDPEELVRLLRKLPSLAALYLRGNPVVSRVPSYRKRLVAELPALRYLDDRPVGEEERACAEAWLSGGVEAEQLERDRLRQEARRHRAENAAHLDTLLQPSGESDPPASPEPSEDDSEPEPSEPPELVRARQALLAHDSAESGAQVSGGTSELASA